MIHIQLKKKGDETIMLHKKAIQNAYLSKVFNHDKSGKLFFLRNFEMHNLWREERAWL